MLFSQIKRKWSYDFLNFFLCKNTFSTQINLGNFLCCFLNIYLISIHINWRKNQILESWMSISFSNIQTINRQHYSINKHSIHDLFLFLLWQFIQKGVLWQRKTEAYSVTRTHRGTHIPSCTTNYDIMMQIIENRWGNWLKDILITFTSSQQPEVYNDLCFKTSLNY